MRTEINNSGAGNCMYYAYGISLMYFLRSKCTKEQIDIVFNNLKLSDDVKDGGVGVRTKLHALISNSKNRPFSDSEHKTIERILGPATRALAAERSMEEFRAAPRSSHVYPIACFYMRLMLKRAILKKEHALAKVLKPAPDKVKEEGAGLLGTSEIQALKRGVPDRLMDEVWDQYNRKFAKACAGMEEGDRTPKNLKDTQKNILVDVLKGVKGFGEAELVKVVGMEEGIQRFAEDQRDAILKEFNKRWDEKLAALPPDKRTEADLDFYQEQIFEALVDENSIKFFKDNEEARLKQYGAHLNTNYKWGSTEVLFSLHQAVTGEKTEQVEVEVPEGQPKRKSWVQKYDVQIQLSVFRDGEITTGQSGDRREPDLVLNNQSNVHWVSLIPPEFYPLERTVSAPVVTKTATPPVVTKPEAVPVVPIVSPTSRLMASSSVPKPDQPSLNPKELQLRENLLEASEFNKGLTSLKAIKDALSKAGYHNESDTAELLYGALHANRKLFLDGKITAKEFSDKCSSEINRIPKHQLYSALLSVVNFILNALVVLLTLTTANWYYGKFQIIKPSCYTNSLLTIGELRKSAVTVDEFNRSPLAADPLQGDRDPDTQPDAEDFGGAPSPDTHRL